MNLLIGLKKRCVKFGPYGLGLLAIGGVVYTGLHLKNAAPIENRNVVTTPSVSEAESNTGFCGSDCSHSGHGKAKAASRNKPAVSFKHVAVQGSDSMTDSKVGDLLDLDFGNKLQVSGRVTVNKKVANGRQAVFMELVGQKGRVYWLENSKGGVLGDVVINEGGENKVYKFTGTEGDWHLQELGFKEYICASDVTDESVGMPASDAPFTPAGQSAIIPLLNSLPSAEAVLYMDFDGEVVTGTRWVNGQTINALESGHTEAEIREIWAEVSEDMRPFHINVTTDRAVFDAAPIGRRMQVIVTPTHDAAPGAGGVAYLTSFYDGSDDPCWCFNLGGGSTAMTISHEVGHTFGLRHDGLGAREYHPGNGTWGPIMGAPFGHDFVSWSEGNYVNSTNTEDDLALITALNTNGFGYREDDYGNSNGAGFDLSANVGSEAVSVLGVIERSDDVDVFSFTTSGGATLLTATPTVNLHNANIRVRLFDDAGNLVSESDPLGVYSASVSTNLDAGAYHFHVEGVADGSPDESGFNDYGSLGQFGLVGNIKGLGGLILDIVEPSLDDVSILDGNGLVLRAMVVGEEDASRWSMVNGPLGGVATFYPATEKASRVTFSQPGLYTLKYTATKDGLESDDTIRVSVEEPGGLQLFENRGPAITVSSPEQFYSREGLLNGRALDDDIPVPAPPAIEWVVVSGTAKIQNPGAAGPIITFQDSAPNVVALESSDGQIRTFKQFSVQSVFEARKVIDSGASASWFVPLNGDLGLTWKEKTFDDSLWPVGPTGIGFNSNLDYDQFLIAGTNIKDAMKGKSSSAYIRIPFAIPSLDHVQGLKLKVHYNDAFVLYVNGVELARRNTEAGTLLWNSKSLRSRDFEDVRIADEIDLSAALAHLVAGENIIAIHGLNYTKKNRTFLINPVLQADIVATPYLAFMELNGLDLAPYGDADGDGILNFVEHALATDPRAFNVAEPLVTQLDGSVKITLPGNMPQDVDYIIEKSVDMVTWKPIATKRGMADWIGDSVLVSVDSTVSDAITFKVRQITALPSSYYRLAYRLRGPAVTP